jgi:hypothetical protein
VKRVLPSRKELLAEIPDAYTESAQALLLSDDPKDRESAGSAIAGAPAHEFRAIPDYLKDLARLETADDCAARRPILLRIEASGDIRALWGLRILDASRREGFKCVHEDLKRVVAAFEAAAG